MKLTPDQKHQICKSFFASAHFNLDTKKALLSKALEGDSSDKAKNVAKVCEWSLPDPLLKQKLWDEITDASTTDSLMDIRLKISGFWQRQQQLDLISPYFDRYYGVLEKVVNERDREFAELFMQNLSPAFMARDRDLKEFQSLLDRTSEERDFFILFLKKQIETIDITKKSRHLCETFKMD